MRKRIRSIAALTALCTIVWGGVCLSAAQGQEPAASADDFVDRIGVCTHWGYADTPYGGSFAEVKRLLKEAGIRHVRDGFHPRETELFHDLGVKTTLNFGPQDVHAVVETLRSNASLVDMVEGPNEVAVFAQSAQYEGAGYPEGPRRFQKALYAALQADPVTSRFGVIAPSTGRGGENRNLRPIEGFDYLVMHSYAGGQMPSRSLESDVNNNREDAYDLIPTGQPLKPIVVTESGYHTAIGGSGGVLAGVQAGVSEAAQAKYLLRHFATYFAAGIVRTFTYEFVDEFPDYHRSEREGTNAEACFGIVRHDLTPKPAYTALKNLIALLSERTWNPARQAWDDTSENLPQTRGATGAPPDFLSFTLTGSNVGTIRHVLLRKRNGDFYLLIWQEVPSFDTATKTDIAVPTLPVTLTLATSSSGGAVYDPRRSAAEPIQTIPASARAVTIGVPDSVLVVRIRPARLAATTPLTARPMSIAAETTAATAHLTWSASDSPAPAGYFVSRLGQFVGQTTVPAFDDRGLRPGTGYPYSVRAFSADGRVGPPVSVVATTKAQFPDLVVAECGVDPPKPKPGQSVTFTAAIRNIGKAPTPSGVTLGVAFSIDGKVVNWSDRFSGPLKPGETARLRANNGPLGKATFVWPSDTAAHTLRAVVDDVNRVAESDKSNNVREVILTTAP